MKLMFSLAVKHLKVNNKRTFFTLLAIVLSVAMFTAVSGITASTYNAFYDFSVQTGRDMGGAMRELGTVLYSVAAFLAVVVMAGSVIVIANAFSISAGERVRQFGILKSVGATREQILMTVLSEGICMCAIGIPLGIIAGFGITAVGATLADNLLGSLTVLNKNNVAGAVLDFRVVFNIQSVAAATVLSFVTVMLSAWFTARKVSKLSAMEAIKLTGETKIKAISVKTSRLTERVFGFEGTLAAKSLKRSRRKYRATIVSLVTSMVLVIISSGFGQLLFRSVEILVPDINANVLISNGAVLSLDEADALTERFSAYPNTSVQRVMPAMWTLTKYPDDFNPPSMNGERPMLYLICLDEQTYTDYCKKNGVAPGSIILLNEIPAKFNMAQEFAFADGNGVEHSLEISAQSGEFIPLLREFYAPFAVNVVISADMARELGVNVGAVWFANTENPSEFCNYADEILTSDFNINDLTKQAAEIKQIYLLVMIFIYGFIAMLTLIGVTSVIATVYSGIQLRTPEFAVLSSVGMTPGGLRRMLNLESLLYGLKSLLIGLPLGIALSYVLFRLFRLQINFAFEVPWMAVGLCVLGTFAVTFISMRYAASQIRRGNIAETMRAVNI